MYVSLFRNWSALSHLKAEVQRRHLDCQRNSTFIWSTNDAQFSSFNKNWCRIGFSELKRLKHAIPFENIRTTFLSILHVNDGRGKKLNQLTYIRGMIGDVWDMQAVFCWVPCRTQYDPITNINAKDWKREKPMLFWYLLYVLLLFPLHFIHLLFFTRGQTLFFR